MTRTIALPAGSQPFGIVAAPTGTYMYVALEGTGRLLKIDGSESQRSREPRCGTEPAPLTVTGDGNRCHVSRFITRPLPGEGHGDRADESAGQPVGGEIVVVNGPAMSTERTIVLRH